MESLLTTPQHNHPPHTQVRWVKALHTVCKLPRKEEEDDDVSTGADTRDASGSEATDRDDRAAAASTKRGFWRKTKEGEVVQ